MIQEFTFYMVNVHCLTTGLVNSEVQ